MGQANAQWVLTEAAWGKTTQANSGWVGGWVGAAELEIITLLQSFYSCDHYHSFYIEATQLDEHSV